MMRCCTGWKTLGLLLLLLSACEGGLPIAGIEPPIEKVQEQGPPSGSIQLTNLSVSTLPQTTVGDEVEIAHLRLVGSGRTTTVDEVVLMMSGTALDNDLADFRISRDGKLLCAMMANITNGRVILDMVLCPILLEVSLPADIKVTGRVVDGAQHYVQMAVASAFDIHAHDLLGKTVPVSLAAGSWPLLLSRVTISHGNLIAKPADFFTNQTILTTTATEQTIAVFTEIPHGEDVEISGFTLDFIFGDGLAPGYLSNLRIVDDIHGQIAPTINTLPAGIIFKNLNLVQTNGKVANEALSGVFRAGAQGTVQACLRNIQAHGHTSLENLPVPDVCGAIMTVHP